jgi:hypothetical protein
MFCHFIPCFCIWSNVLLVWFLIGITNHNSGSIAHLIIYVVDIHMGVDMFYVFPLKANKVLQYEWFLNNYL